MELISVIIPVYNCEKWIKRCIISILEQTYSNIEVIIIDDGSTDNSLQICKSYETDKIKVFTKPNTGVSDTRNLGIEKANGDYLFFVDADDYLKNDAIEQLYKLAKQYDADVVKCNYDQFDDSKIVKQENFRQKEVLNLEKELDKKKLTDWLIETYYLNNVWGQLMSTKKAKQIKFDTNLAMGEDFIYNYELFEICKKIVIIPESYYCYYYNQNGMAFNESIAKIKRKIEDTLYFYEKLLNEPQKIEEQRIFVNAIKELTKHVVMLATNNEIDKKEKKQYLQKIVNNSFLRKAEKVIIFKDIDFENKRYQITGKYLLDGNYKRLYFYLEYIYQPLKRIKGIRRSI